MKKLLVVSGTLKNRGGIETALLGMLELLTRGEFDIDLLLLDDSGELFNRIPKQVNVLPVLKQFDAYSPQLMEMFSAQGRDDIVGMREQIKARNDAWRAQGKDEGELFALNWEEQQAFCPEFSGYDIAIAYIENLPLKIVADKVKAGKKMVWMHIDLNECPMFSRQSQFKFLKKMDYIIGVCKTVAKSIVDVYPEFRDKVKWLPNHVPREYITTKADECYPSEFAKESFNIFTAGRLCRQKGTDFIIEAVEALKEQTEIPFKWFVAGDYWRQLQENYLDYHKIAEEKGVLDKLVFLGDRINPYPYFKNCDLYVQPSRFEGKPVAVDEAKILGCAILLTRYPCAEKYYDSSYTHFCDMSGVGVAQGVLELMNNPELRNKLKSNTMTDYLPNGEMLMMYNDIFVY